MKKFDSINNFIQLTGSIGAGKHPFRCRMNLKKLKAPGRSLLFYYLVKIKGVKIYQYTCVYIGIVHRYIKSDFYHLTFFIPFL